jgi:hypothetical protein
MTSPVVHNSKNNEWYTPSNILDLARLFLVEIDLDVASCETSNINVKAKNYFDLNNDALSKNWNAKTVWMNPPYSKDLFDKFINKFIQEFENKSFQKGVVITNNNTETKAGQMLLKNCSFALFFSKRIKFLNKNLKPANTPTQGQVLYFFGASKDDFVLLEKEIEKHGTILFNYKNM